MKDVTNRINEYEEYKNSFLDPEPQIPLVQENKKSPNARILSKSPLREQAETELKTATERALETIKNI